MTASTSSTSLGFRGNSYYQHGTEMQQQCFFLLFIVTASFAVYIALLTATKCKYIYINEAVVMIITGLICSVATISVGYSDILTKFNSQFFFVLLLPPIVFSSSFKMNRKLFYSNFLSIISFANVGTVISCLIIGYALYELGIYGWCQEISLMENLSFGSLISATDPVSTLAVFETLKVDENLYTIVLASSVLDDAISYILFQTYSQFIDVKWNPWTAFLSVTIYFIVSFIASVIIGYFIGIVAALIIKRTPELRSQPRIISFVMLLTTYFAYLIPSVIQMSGIISCFYAGISFRLYLGIVLKEDSENFNFLSESTGFVAYTSELIVFFSIGLSLFEDNERSKAFTPSDFTYALWAFIMCLVGRAAFVYPLSFLINKHHEHRYGSIGSSSNSGGKSNDSDSIIHANKHAVPPRPPRPSSSFSLSLSPISQPQTHTLTHNQEVSVTTTAAAGRDKTKNTHNNSNSNSNSKSNSYKELFYKISQQPARISSKAQHLIFFAGLRGPIALATSQIFPSSRNGDHYSLINSTTKIILMITIFVVGGATGPLLQYLNVGKLDLFPANSSSGDCDDDHDHDPTSTSDVESSPTLFDRTPVLNPLSHQVIRTRDTTTSTATNDNTNVNILSPTTISSAANISSNDDDNGNYDDNDDDDNNNDDDIYYWNNLTFKTLYDSPSTYLTSLEACYVLPLFKANDSDDGGHHLQ